MTVKSYDWIAHHARVRPDKAAVRDAGTGARVTYAELDDRVDRLASVLQRELGVGEGDRVAVHAQNDGRIFEVQFACWRLGAIFVPLNWRLALPELEFIVGDCAPRVLVHEAGFADVVVPLAEAAGVSHRLCWGGESTGAVDYEEDVADGVVGELWVRGPNITPGYWNRPDATAESITDGWLHTGDAARRDEEGYYFIVDRWKDMYISGGENVYPAEVEDVLYQLPDVGEAAVIGVPDERWVEVGRAILVLRPGTSLTEKDVIRHCVERLAKFKVPKSVVFVDELPHNATGKILKRELRDRFGEA